MTQLDVVHIGDARSMDAIEDETVQTCVTSPPYWGLRDYDVDDQIGLEGTPDEYIDQLVQVFREVHRVLRDDGTLWLNLGDSYATGAGAARIPGGKNHDGINYPRNQPNRGKLPGLKPKDLVGMPWRMALALQADGWWLRSDIIWAKPNPMPSSVRDRPTTAHEYLFLLTKNQRYYWDREAAREETKPYKVKEPDGWDQEPGAHETIHRKGRKKGKVTGEIRTGRNIRTVWTITPSPFPEAHFATFPLELPSRCISISSRPGDLVLDPFMGSGTTALAAAQLARHYTGYELNPEYHELIAKRLAPFKNQTRLEVSP